MTQQVTPPALRRPRHALFRFTDAVLKGRELQLGYQLAGGPDPDVAFTETLQLPDSLPAPDPADPLVQKLVDGCHRAFGVSYFKAALPAFIDAVPVSGAEAAFWNQLYTEGLGEFYFRNGLSPLGKAAFPERADPQPALIGSRGDAGSLVLIGGGKDSALVADIVAGSGSPAAALALGDSHWIRRSATAAGLPLHVIGRRLDPRLLELNAAGAWNGHVPISACIAFVATLVAQVSGYAELIVGNERGADDASVTVDGITINHQWSKSLRFERAFRAWCALQYSQGPSYFSLLRPLSELRIASLFAALPAQHGSFTSCNANFRQGRSQHARWCGHCAKCVFVALLLAPHMQLEQLRQIFDSDFLDDNSNVAVLEALLGVGSGKPWDCVGTLQECRVSLTALARQQRLGPVLQALVRQHPEVLLGDAFAAAWEQEWALSEQHCLGPGWQEKLHAYLDAHR